VLALNDVESADSRADIHARALGHFLVFDFVASRLQGLVGSGDRQMNKARHLARFLLLHVLEGIEILDLSPNLAGELRHIEAGDALNAAGAGQQRLPHILCVVADPAYQPDSRYDDATSQATFLSSGY